MNTPAAGSTNGSTEAPIKNGSSAANLPQLPVHHMELNLKLLEQLFNTMDPSPFHERDLDDDAAEYILSWAEELPRKAPVDLVIHLETAATHGDTQPLIRDAVHNYFAYRHRLNRLEMKRLMKQGQLSLVVGILFLAICLLLSGLLLSHAASTWQGFFKEGLTIAGWVAMWKPLEIYLYEWWPIQRRGRILDKLSRMSVTVRTPR